MQVRWYIGVSGFLISERGIAQSDGAIAKLPETQREVLLLAHYERLSVAEIAEITQLEVAAVKSRLQRARATLREFLAAYSPRTENAI
jgi:RNA polymerase sigma-70 factor (ECF subfamily)